MKIVIENARDKAKANLMIQLLQMFANETIHDIVNSIQESEKPVIKENEDK